MSILPRSDAFFQTSSKKRARAVVALVVALVTGVGAMLRIRFDRSSTVCLTPTADGIDLGSPQAPKRPELIRSVRSFSSLQIVNAKEKPFNKYIAQAALEHDIDPALLRAVIQTESNFSPRVVSRAGARGLMQLMPTTAREFGVRRRMLFNARENIRTGAAYLSKLARHFGENRAELIIAAYNAGPGAVARYGGVPPYRETQDYVERVTKRWIDAAPVNPIGADVVVTPETSGPPVQFASYDLRSERRTARSVKVSARKLERRGASRGLRSRKAPLSGRRFAVKTLKGPRSHRDLVRLLSKTKIRGRRA